MKKTISLAVAIALLTCLCGTSAAEAGLKFKDVPENAWYGESVSRLVEKGAIVGYPNGNFGPNDNITVEQLIKVVVVATGNKIQPDKGAKWSKPYIDFALASGMITQSEFGSFSRPITRGEIARMLVRSIKWESYRSNLSDYSRLILDYNKMDSNLQEFVLKAYVKGIMAGYPDKTFRASNNATRAEAAAMVLRLIDTSKRQDVPIINPTKDDTADYTAYIEPQDLIRKVADLEMKDNYEEAIKYIDPEYIKNHNFTADVYRANDKYHISIVVFYIYKYAPDGNYPIRCKVMEKYDDNYILMAFDSFDQIVVGKDDVDYPYDMAAKEMRKVNGLWYIDPSLNVDGNPKYAFMYHEGI